MHRILVTGFSGFVSQHFLRHLASQGEALRVLGLDLTEPEFSMGQFDRVDCTFRKVDLLEAEQIRQVLSEFRPDYILHLASFSSVAYSWQHPVASFTNNTTIFLNLLEQVKRLGLKCRILSVGSSEQYGNVSPEDMPLTEEHPLHPVSPYAVARVSQEMLSRVYVEGYDQDIVLTRSFNHIGTGQKEIFVISSFVKKILEIGKTGSSTVLETGNLEIVRDFLDVRDVVRAYYELLLKGEKGQVYNICSGTGHSLKKVVETISTLTRIPVTTQTNPDLVRPNDNQIIVGSYQKLYDQTGWKPRYSLEQSLEEIITYWQRRE